MTIMASFGGEFEIEAILGSLIFTVPAVGLIVWRVKRYPGKLEAYEKEYAVYQQKVEKINSDASSIINSAKALQV